MGVGAFIRARDRLLAAELGDQTARMACEELLRSFHEVARFSWGTIMLTDPRTLLPCGGVVEGFPAEACAPFWDNELLDADFVKFNDLAQRFDPVATLADAVDGDLARSPRYRNLYEPMGAGDELRTAFVTGTACLAVGCFVRRAEDGPFSQEEVADARHLVAVATGVVRRAIGGVADAPHADPVVILLDERGNVTATSAGGGRVLEALGLSTASGGELFEHDLPVVVRTAASKARWSRTSSTLTTRLHARDGQWLRLHVAPMEGDPNTVAVTVSHAPPRELARMVVESYGLTPRETDVALLLCRGMSAKTIATELAISAHTVRDHTKPIYDKAGVSGRGELMGNLLASILPHVEAIVTRVD